MKEPSAAEATRCNWIMTAHSGTKKCEQLTVHKICARRRAYNRAYMRAWRADPRNLWRERATRKKAYESRKLRTALHENRAFMEKFGAAACGFCRKHRSVVEILRLRIRPTVRGEYVRVRIPYCGQC